MQKPNIINIVILFFRRLPSGMNWQIYSITLLCNETTMNQNCKDELHKHGFLLLFLVP